MIPYSAPQRTKALFLLLLGNYFVSLFISRPYLSFGPPLEDPAAWIYTRVAYLSTIGMIYLILWMALWPWTRWIPSRKQLYILPPIVLFLAQVFFIVDVQIYGIFRFHVNGLVINLLTTEGAGDSVQLGGGTWLTFSGYVMLLLLLEWGGIWGILRLLSGPARWPKPFHLFHRSPVWIWILFIPVLLLDKGMFAYANFYEMTQITRYQKLFPLYLPLFADETLEKYLGWKKEHSWPIESGNPYTLLAYPSQGFQMEDHLKPVNMVWIAVESWRFDMLTPEITPHLYDFSKESWTFENHYSGGNATRFGVFSLLYGLYGTYWHQILAERRSPVLLDELQHLGYDFKIMSSTQLSYPEFRRTAFIHLPPDSIEDRLPGNGGPERDPEMAKRFEAFLQNRNPEKPFFAFMFLDSPHAPYRYPTAFEKFVPVADEINYFQVKKAQARVDEGHPLFNRYRNSVFYADSVVRQMLTSIEKRGLLNATVVVITGDHGEEFYETGYYGHNSAFSDYQLKVPFILHLPGVTPRKVTRLTSHLDLVPTMFQLMGSRQDPALYSHGSSLLNESGERYVVASGWDTFAVIDPRVRFVLSTEIYHAGTAEVRVGRYELANDPKPILAAHNAELLEVTRKLSNFLR